jgi:hypothetical protein
MPSADEAFRAAAIERAARRRARRPASFLTWLSAGAVALAAVVATGAQGGPDGPRELPARLRVDAQDAANRQGGTSCPGWPAGLTPSQAPQPVDGALSLWAERDAFHLHNASPDAVTVEVEAVGGQLRSVGGGGQVVAANRVRFQIDPGGDVRFSAECISASLVVRGLGSLAVIGGARRPLPVTVQRSG